MLLWNNKKLPLCLLKYHCKIFLTKNDLFRLVIDIFVNWYISKDILPRIASYTCESSSERCPFIGVAMTTVRMPRFHEHIFLFGVIIFGLEVGQRKTGEGHFGAAVSAPPTRRRRFGDSPFPNFFFFRIMKKKRPIPKDVLFWLFWLCTTVVLHF